MSYPFDVTRNYAQKLAELIDLKAPFVKEITADEYSAIIVTILPAVSLVWTLFTILFCCCTSGEKPAPKIAPSGTKNVPSGQPTPTPNRTASTRPKKTGSSPKAPVGKGLKSAAYKA